MPRKDKRGTIAVSAVDRFSPACSSVPGHSGPNRGSCANPAHCCVKPAWSVAATPATVPARLSTHSTTAPRRCGQELFGVGLRPPCGKIRVCGAEGLLSRTLRCSMGYVP